MKPRLLGAALAAVLLVALASPAPAQVVRSYYPAVTRPVATYYAPPVVSYYPAPVVTDYAPPAPVVRYYAATPPVVNYYPGPAPVVSYDAGPSAITYRYGLLGRRGVTYYYR